MSFYLPRRWLKKVVGVLFTVYCVIYFINSMHPTHERHRLVPGRDNLCPPLSTRGSQRHEISTNIFFLETSGEPCLTARQACSVESAARANPDAIVTVHMESDWRRPSEIRKAPLLAGQRRNCAVTKKLFDGWRTNIKLARQDLLQHLTNTSLSSLHQKGLLNQSSHPLTHRSDAVRVAMLWKYGGIYLDLDCLVFRPIHCLRNTVGLVDFLPDWVENGVMTYDKGHPFVRFLMKYMVFAYKADEYISLGPATLTDAIKYYCDRNQLPADEWLTCRNSSMILQSPRAFYAINNRRQNAFYHPQADPQDFEELRYSYLSHIYDAGNGRPVPKDSLYGLLAKDFCPMTYHMAFESEGEL